MLETAWEALEHAGQAPDRLGGSKTGVFIGISSSDYAIRQYGDLAALDAYAGTGNAASIAANRLSYALDLRGPSMVVDTACSSSLVAIHLACRSLRSGEARMALAGGVNLILAPELTITFSHARMMAADGRCKTFDAAADGYVRGEGCGVVVLKRLSDALADGDRVLALIRGSAVNQDGRSNGLTAPNGLAQQEVIRAALDDAGVAPHQLGYVEAHGTGTILGDPIEVRALDAVMQGRPSDQPCVLGSVKTNIGHLEAAAGIAGLIKVVLALKHELIPAHLHLRAINPHILLDQMPLVIPTEQWPWPAADGRRYAGVSSFGFGGTNAHVVLEEAPAPTSERNTAERPWQMLSLSAKDAPALRALARRFATYLDGQPDQALADICFSANTGRAHFAQRLALAAETTEEARASLAAFADGQEANLRASQLRAAGRPKIAFLFTGQGAQYIDMGRELYATQPTFRAALDRCAEILRSELELDIRDVLYPTEQRTKNQEPKTDHRDSVRPALRGGPTDDPGEGERGRGGEGENGQSPISNLQSPLDQTQYTQPTLFAIEYALAELWRSWGIVPDFVMGHSVGEYAAACVAGVFSLEDGLRLIAARGRLMQLLPPNGAMAVVFAEEARVAEALAQYAGRVVIAAVNGPTNIAISGEREVLQAVLAELKAERVGVQSLNVSHAFHSPLMEPILEAFEQVARGVEFRAPRIPLVANLTGQVPAPGEILDAAYWRRHLREPVLFADGMQALTAQGCDVFLEVGPHPSLLGMGKRCLPGNTAVWAPSLKKGQPAWPMLLDGLALLYLGGVEVSWRGFDGDYARALVELPTYPFQRERFWIEPAAHGDRQNGGAHHRAVSRAGHALLGVRLRSPLNLIQFEAHLSARSIAHLDGRSDAAYRELALAAADEVFGRGAHGVTDMTVHEALALPVGGRTVQTVLTPGESGIMSFQIFSLTELELDPAWTLHSGGIIYRGQALADAAERALESPLTREILLAAGPERQELLVAYLRGQVAGALGMSPARLPADQPLNTLGLDSIMAIVLKNSVETGLGLQVPLASLLQGPTTAELAVQLVAQLDEAPDEAATRIVAGDPVAEYPLAHGQRALWLQHQVAPDSVYNPVYAVRIGARVDVAALRDAFQALIDRHPELRASFFVRDGLPHQRVRERVEVAFDHVDAASWSAADLHNRLDEEAYRPFDLENDPLLRLHLFSRSEEEHVLLMSAHHIVVDLWSQAIITHEFGALYAARAGQTALPELPLRYSDYVRWHAELLAGPEGERLWGYWRERLAGKLPVLNLPTDRPRPVVQTFRGGSRRSKLDAALTQRLRTIGEQHGATLYTTLLAAFKVLLYRYSGQTDLIIGTPTTGRSREELAGLVGYFVNPVALRTNLAEDPSFAALLGQVRQTVVEALEHQDYPLALLVEKLQPERDAGRTPLFQVMFVLQRAHLLADQGLSSFAVGGDGVQMQIGGLPLEAIDLERRTAPFDLTLMMAEAGDGLAASITYNADLYDAETIDRMLGHYQVLLESVAANPLETVARLPILTPAERLMLRQAASGARADYPIEHCAHVLFEAQVERTPDAVAVVSDDQQLTYRELNRRANQLAHYLRARGVGPETLVGVCVERSPVMVVGLLGVLKAGGAYVPMDPNYPAERIQYMLEDAQVSVLLTTEEQRTKNKEQRIDSTTERKGVLHTPPADDEGVYRTTPPADPGQPTVIDLVADWPTIAQQPAANPESGVTADSLAYVIYTSGSTGRPKGVLLQHRGLCNLAHAQMEGFAIGAASRVLQFASFSFDASVSEIFTALLSGAALCLARPEALLSSTGLGQLLRDRAITIVTLPPSLLALLPPDDLPALWTVISAGERCAPEIAARWSKGRRFINAYGPTEATIGPTMYVADGRAIVGASVPIGRPIPNIQVYLLDAHHQPVPIGVAGEIAIGGVGLARGYLNRPDLTAERFVPSPWSVVSGQLQRTTDNGQRTTDNRLYRTGDLGRYLPDGTIEFVGRADQQVKIRGFRIELGEVEAALKRHPNVREAVVLAREDAPGDNRMVAYVVPGQEQRRENKEQSSEESDSQFTIHNSQFTIQELRDFLKDQLPEYMLPAVFVTLDALPLTPNGKVDRKALAAPKGTRPELAATYVMPRNELEQTLAAIWQDVLLVDQVGIDDNFFELGGHSLLMAKVHSQLQAALQREISIVELFRHPTIGALAEYLSKAPAVRSLQENADRAEKQRSGLQRQQQRMQAVAQRRAAGRQRR